MFFGVFLPSFACRTLEESQRSSARVSWVLITFLHYRLRQTVPSECTTLFPFLSGAETLTLVNELGKMCYDNSIVPVVATNTAGSARPAAFLQVLRHDCLFQVHNACNHYGQINCKSILLRSITVVYHNWNYLPHTSPTFLRLIKLRNPGALPAKRLGNNHSKELEAASVTANAPLVCSKHQSWSFFFQTFVNCC